MRWTLFNWILDVASPDAMNLHHSCLWLCFSIIDNYLNCAAYVGKDHLQVVGITALFISAKMNAVDVPSSHDFDFYTDDMFTKADIIRTEKNIMLALQFQLMDPLSFSVALDVCHIHPHSHYLWDLILVGCETLYEHSCIDVWEFCKQLGHLLSDRESASTSLTLTVPRSWKTMVVSLMETIHQEKSRIEKGKRTALQRKFSRQPFTNVALNVMVDVSRVRFKYSDRPVQFYPFSAKDSFDEGHCETDFDDVDERAQMTQSGGVLTRAATKRMREQHTTAMQVLQRKSVAETQQYLIKKRKTRSVSHKWNVQPPEMATNSSENDVVSKMLETRKRRPKRCQAVTKWGKQCTRKITTGAKFCPKHDKK
jgi:hypothetical protein